MNDIHIVAVVLASVLLLAVFTTAKPQDAQEENASENESGAGMEEIVVLETSMGNIEIELDRENAPVTVENFMNYVNLGFYDGTVFHRVIPGFMVQGGGFTTDGTEKETNAPIKLESDNGLGNERGTVAMARTNQPDSATSQFFINVADNPFLDYAEGNEGYAVFGRVVSGMDVVDEIKSVPTTTKYGLYQDWPVEDVVITRAYIKK
jgi:cyclophilin family peptidyl-prolyl cis-trans isomerase